LHLAAVLVGIAESVVGSTVAVVVVVGTAVAVAGTVAAETAVAETADSVVGTAGLAAENRTADSAVLQGIQADSLVDLAW
jgi:hypothetical protein